MLFILVMSAAWAGTCESDWIGVRGKPSPVCRALEQKPTVLARNADGTILVNPTAFERRIPAELRAATRHPNRSPSQLAQLNTQFEDLKRSMLDQVTRGQAESNWNTHQKYLVARLRSVKLQFEYDEEHCDGPRGALNANYSQSANVVTLCPIYSHMPAQAALGIMAHELGHLADPCNYAESFAFGTAMRGQNALERQARLRRAANQCLGDVGGLGDYLQFLARPTVRENSAVALYPFQSGPQRAYTERLADCGTLERPPAPAPRTYEGNPFLSLISCVSRHFPEGKAGPAREITARRAIEAEPHCAGHTHTKECQADHLGMGLFQYHLQKNSGTATKDALFYMQMNHCSDRGEPQEGDAYPLSDERLRLLFQSSEARRLAGCEGADKPKCEIPNELLRPLSAPVRVESTPAPSFR